MRAYGHDIFVWEDGKDCFVWLAWHFPSPAQNPAYPRRESLITAQILYL